MIGDVIEVRTEERPDGWAVIVTDKYETYESVGLTEADAIDKAQDITFMIHGVFHVKTN